MTQSFLPFDALIAHARFDEGGQAKACSLYFILPIDLERGMEVSNRGGKMGDGVDSYGKWCNVGLYM